MSVAGEDGASGQAGSGADEAPEPLRPDTGPGVPAEQVALWHVLLRCFGRTPTPKDLQNWGRVLRSGQSAASFLERLTDSPPFRKLPWLRMAKPPGHFYSPVVDPDTVRGYLAAARQAGPGDFPGIEFDLDAMEAFWHANADFIASTPWGVEPTPPNRYTYLGGPYNYGDATTARAMIGHFRPRRVIEIGSGYSSACMLDAAEHAGLDDFRLTCIEPYPGRLRSVLRPEDFGTRVTLIEQGVQQVDLDMFRTLEPGDILFIDSSHVLKTGSDVHYELFHILPVLRPGVMVHFHDCRFPLEYSDKLIFEQHYSWNEVYAVRALLSYSRRYRVFFSGSLFAAEREALVRKTFPTFLQNPGSALWISVLGD